jgi:hypothetical protein
MALQALWFERLKELAPQMAWQCQVAGITNYQYRMRYVGNGLEAWFAPADYTDWKPLIESPLPRDKLVTYEAFALSFPPCPDEHPKMSAAVLFNGVLQERYDDPEVQGGKIALIATNNQLVWTE